MIRERLLVVGNGMAGIRAIEEVLARAPGRYDIAVFGAEPHPAYSRIMLSPMLAGEKRFDEIVTHDRAWYEANGIALHTGVRVTAIHRDARIVVTGDGRSFAYDRLILATGSEPAPLPVPGSELPGVMTFRNAGDVEAMLRQTRDGARAVVIGGGLLGLEAAYGLKQRGMGVTVVHLMPHLMERQLDREAASLLQRELEARGIEVVCSARTAGISGTRQVRGVELADGRHLPADLVVVAIGVRPDIALAREAGLVTARGVVVDGAMRTSDPHIFAAGECAEHDGVCHGLVAPLYDMTKILAATLAGETASYAPLPTATRLKVSGIELFSAGDFSHDEGCEDIILRDPRRGAYRRLVLKNGRLIGAVLYGETSDGAFFFDLIQSGADTASMRDVLIFGRALCEAA